MDGSPRAVQRYLLEVHRKDGFEAAERGGVTVLGDCVGLIEPQDIVSEAAHSREDAGVFSDARCVFAERDVTRVMELVLDSPAAECKARYLYEKVYCARGDMENRIKECQLDLYADRTSTATMRANQLRLWFASMAYVLLCALRRIALHHTPFAKATCGTIRLKLLKIGALVRVSVRRIKVAMASACPAADTWGCAAKRLAAAANARASPA